MNEIFRKVPPAQSKSNFGGPAGGSALERASPPKERLYMACRDDKQYFKEITGGQIVANMLGAFSENYFTKMVISHDPVDRFC